MVFLLMHVVPGDIALLIPRHCEQGGDVNLQDLERLRTKMGRTPLYEQFFSWVWGIAHLDFGTLLVEGAPVLEELKIRLPLTLEVALFATLISTIIAIPLGNAGGHPSRYLDGLRARRQHRGPGHSGVLDRHPDHPLPGDLLRVEPAAGVRPVLGGSMGEFRAVGLAHRHRRLPQCGDWDAHDAFGGAGSDA